MYICKTCHGVFEMPRMAQELVTRDPLAYEDILECPECGSDEVEEAKLCAECGRYFCEDDLIGGHICEECLSNIETDPKTLKDYILYQDDSMEDFAEWYYDTFKRKGN